MLSGIGSDMVVRLTVFGCRHVRMAVCSLQFEMIWNSLHPLHIFTRQLALRSPNQVSA